jgi:hypothetical protein
MSNPSNFFEREQEGEEFVKLFFEVLKLVDNNAKRPKSFYEDVIDFVDDNFLCLSDVTAYDDIKDAKTLMEDFNHPVIGSKLIRDVALFLSNLKKQRVEENRKTVEVNKKRKVLEDSDGEAEEVLDPLNNDFQNGVKIENIPVSRNFLPHDYFLKEAELALKNKSFFPCFSFAKASKLMFEENDITEEGDSEQNPLLLCQRYLEKQKECKNYVPSHINKLLILIEQMALACRLTNIWTEAESYNYRSLILSLAYRTKSTLVAGYYDSQIRDVWRSSKVALDFSVETAKYDQFVLENARNSATMIVETSNKKKALEKGVKNGSVNTWTSQSSESPWAKNWSYSTSTQNKGKGKGKGKSNSQYYNRW